MTFVLPRKTTRLSEPTWVTLALNQWASRRDLHMSGGHDGGAGRISGVYRDPFADQDIGKRGRGLAALTVSGLLRNLDGKGALIRRTMKLFGPTEVTVAVNCSVPNDRMNTCIALTTDPPGLLVPCTMIRSPLAKLEKVAEVPATLKVVCAETATFMGELPRMAMKVPDPRELTVASKSLGKRAKIWTWLASTTRLFEVIEPSTVTRSPVRTFLTVADDIPCSL